MTLHTPNFIKKTGLVIMVSGVLFACNDGNKKEDADIEFEQTMEVEEDTVSNYAYEGNAVSDYLTYIDGEDEYEETMSLGKTAGDVVTAETLRLIGEL